MITVDPMKRLVLSVMLVAAACSSGDANEPALEVTATTGGAIPASSTTSTLPAPTTSTTLSPFARPDWLGTRILPLRPDENGEVQPTPIELQDRTFETIDLLPPPLSEEFVGTRGPVPPDVQARSSWTEECPVGIDDMAYLTVSHYGFDGDFHTGELMVNSSVAEDALEVFGSCTKSAFPSNRCG